MSGASGRRRDIVLVHGGWHGGWCWSRVVPQLIARGHRVFAPSLTGLADRRHLLTPEVDLSTHIADVANLIEWESLSEVVLVGHSYGGLVVSGAAEQVESAIDTLVFLDAIVPQDGESAWDYAGGALAARDDMPPSGRSTAVVDPVPAAFFSVNEADQPWVDRLCTPHPHAAMVEPVGLTGARERIRRRVYVRATGFPGPLQLEALAMARSTDGWEGLEVVGGHDAMIDAPSDVAALIAAVAEN